MRSSRAKVLHELLGRPLVGYPVELARALGADPVVAVLGHQREAVEAALLARFGAERGRPSSSRPSSAGRATPCGWRCRRWRASSGELVLVLYGDVPLLRRETLEELVGPRAATAAWRWSPRRRPIPPATAGSCATSAAT